MKIHAIQHNPFEGLGNILGWASKNGHSVSTSKMYKDARLPNLLDVDLLIILGGQMSVHTNLDWLKKEKEFIQEAISKKIKIIGICLGAQLLAEALGAKVFKHIEREIGWFPISKTESMKGYYFFDRIDSFLIPLHWHHDSFEIPKNATHIWQSEACKNQAFLYENHILALQFHLETTKTNLKKMIEYGSDDLRWTGPYVQGSMDIFEGQVHMTRNRQVMYSILDWFCKI